jgi:hypothetical protein
MSNISSRAELVAAAVAFHVAVEFFRPVFLGAVEHHVLEEVGDAGGAGVFVAGADFVEEVHGHVRNGVIFLHDHLHSVGQRLGLDVLATHQAPGQKEGRPKYAHGLRYHGGRGVEV